MSLSEKHRSNIYRGLAPVVGDEEAQALVTEISRPDFGSLATKQDLASEIALTKEFVRAEIAEFRTEVKGDIAGLRTEVKGDIAGLRTEVKGDIAGLRTEVKDEIAGLRTEMHDLFRRQTAWTVGATTTAIAAFVGLTQILG